MTPETYPQLVGFYEGSISFTASYIDSLLKSGRVEDPEAVKELTKIQKSLTKTIEDGKKYFEEIVKK